MNDNERLEQARARVTDDRIREGIGTLGEKTLHAVLKYYYQSDESFHEQKIGRYYADIATPAGVIEIQTRGFDRLRKKLEAFLAVGEVTVVYPVPAIKYLVWINHETGEMSKPHKSPKRGNIYAALNELPYLGELLLHPGLSFRVLLLDITEYRTLNGWSKDKKKGSTRFERIPEAISHEYCLSGLFDFQALVPQSLPAAFCAKDFQRAAGLSPRQTSFGLSMLIKLGLLVRTGKKGNAYIYERIQIDEMHD